jgi:hypothetical protein
MTTPNPITPPPELVQKWAIASPCEYDNTWAYEQYIAAETAKWAADQELEACCAWLEHMVLLRHQHDVVPSLRAARRPKPPSLKEQALEELEHVPVDPEGGMTYSGLDLIRRALEALPND